MNNKTSFNAALVFSLAAAALTQPAIASPLVSIGDNADIYFRGTSNLQWSSNVYRDNTNEQDDIMLSLTPGFEFDLGRGASSANFSIITGYEIRRYQDLDDLDTELFNILATGSYETSRLDLSSSVSFRERKAATQDILLNGDLVESDQLNGNINSEYRFSPKFSFGAGFRYVETSYNAPYDALFSDTERFTLPFDVFYELSPKVDLSVGYSYGETDVQSSLRTPVPYTTEDHYFNVGARGNLLPKLTGFFKVGYKNRDTDRAGDSSRSTLGLDADLTWLTTPKLTNRLGFSRGFGVGGEGNSVERTTISLNTNYSINSYYGVSTFASYTMRDYDNIGREDDQYQLGARFTYTPNQYWSFGAGYTYSENESDDPTQVPSSIRSYTDHTLNVTASLRY